MAEFSHWNRIYNYEKTAGKPITALLLFFSCSKVIGYTVTIFTEKLKVVLVNKCVGIASQYYQVVVTDIVHTMPTAAISNVAQRMEQRFCQAVCTPECN